MASFTYVATLIDTKGLKTSLRFPLAEIGHTEALADAALISSKFAAVTDANFYSENLVENISGSTALPADADITDEALVVTYLSGTGELGKFWNLRIPAPADAVFNADLVTVDITNQALQDLVLELSQSALVSDGEAISLDIQEGISHGFWRSIKKSTA